MKSIFDDDELEQKRKKYEEDVVNTQAYRQSSDYMMFLIEDFKKGLILIGMAASRDYTAYKESSLMLGVTDLFGSVTAIEIISNEIVFNAAKRELRYMLEATIKYAAVDQICQGKTFRPKKVRIGMISKRL